MADIFLSYAREDRAAAERVARALAQRGYDVWWDPDIPAGPSYTQVIEQALTSTKCVLVLWSTTSVASSWVQDEAREGKERGVLVAARLADVKPPLGFRGHQLADLAAWDGGADDREFRRLLRGIEAHVPPAGQPAREPLPLPQQSVRSPREAPVSGEANVPRRAVVPPEASAAGVVAEVATTPAAGPTSVRDERRARIELEKARHQYRQKVDETLSDRQISIGERDTLDGLRRRLGLSQDDADEIEVEALKPITATRKRSRSTRRRSANTLRKDTPSEMTNEKILSCASVILASRTKMQQRWRMTSKTGLRTRSSKPSVKKRSV